MLQRLVGVAEEPGDRATRSAREGVEASHSARELWRLWPQLWRRCQGEHAERARAAAEQDGQEVWSRRHHAPHGELEGSQRTEHPSKIEFAVYRVMTTPVYIRPSHAL
eukprot:scaffold74070_cov67-Phaeocystis_antarctica.AAC.1